MIFYNREGNYAIDEHHAQKVAETTFYNGYLLKGKWTQMLIRTSLMISA